MKLIKELQSKSWITSTNKKTSDRFALFECKYCNKHIEIRRAKGIIQKSCGDKECSKKAHADGYNRELSAKNKGNTKDGRSVKPYYSAMKSIYNMKLNELNNIGIDSMDEFYIIMYNSYCEARKLGAKINTIVDSNGVLFDTLLEKSKAKISNASNDIISITKSAEDKINLAKVELENAINNRANNKALDKIKLLTKHKFSSLLIENQTGIKYRTINEKIISLVSTKNPFFIDMPIDIKIGNRKAFILNENQYDVILHSLRKSRVNNSSYIYIIKSNDNQFKIGISSDVDNRFSQIKAMNPPSSNLEIIHKKYIGNGASVLESKIHDKLKKLNTHLHYEWFNLDNKMLIKVISTIDN